MINLIAAISLNNCIGKEGKLPWNYIKSDMIRFKELTKDNVVVMGGNTFFNDLEGKPLPNRINFVLTNNRVNTNFSSDVSNLYLVRSYETCKRYMTSYNKDVFIIGGSKIYTLFFPIVERLYITNIQKEYEGDTFLNIDYSNFNLIEEKKNDEDAVIFNTYHRR